MASSETRVDDGGAVLDRETILIQWLRNSRLVCKLRLANREKLDNGQTRLSRLRGDDGFGLLSKASSKV